MTQNFLFQKYLQQILKCEVNLVKREGRRGKERNIFSNKST